MKIQHLVLDDDVHKALKARKKKVGITVKEIGNSALRAALSIPTKEELIVEKLVETGRITRRDYEEAVAVAEKTVRALHKKAAEAAVRESNGKRWTMGSWSIEEVLLSPDGQVQVLDLRPRDAKKQSTPVVVHDDAHAHGVVLSGRVRMQINGRERALGAHETINVEPGTPYAVAPLTRSARLVVVATPALDFGG